MGKNSDYQNNKSILALDLGSRSVKIALQKKDSGIELYDYDTALFYDQFGEPSNSGFQIDFSKFGLNSKPLIKATGYGRNALNIADAEITPEIQAHAKGAIYQTGMSDFTLLDLGGQDSKIIWIEDSKIEDFFMNNRCAASAGRYLENMANTLGMGLEELSRYWENPEKLSATCAVFGESELVGKMAKGVSRERLAAGVNQQIVKKFAAKLDARPPQHLVLVGGVAMNQAITKLLAIKYQIRIIIPEYPQHNGVIGLFSENPMGGKE